MQGKPQAAPRRRTGLPAIGAGLAVAGAFAAYLLAADLQGDAEKPLSTSEVEDFQKGQANGGRLNFEAPEPEQRVEEAIIRIEDALEVPAPPPASEQDPGLTAELAAMRQALAESTASRDKVIAEAVEQLKSAFEDRAAELETAARQAQSDLLALQSSSAARENSLQALLDAERMQRQALEREMASSEALALEALLAEQAARDAAELERRQIESPAVIFASSQATVTAGNGAQDGSSGRRKLSANEAFLQSAPALTVQQAERMQVPDRTLAQGSVVQAALQVAINSDLPGNVIAVVTEPVPSFAGDNILIPRGSRLFGAYSAGIDAGQKRILIAWNRILTPEGVSMQISSVGGDQLGRSGVTGLVDSKFGERFGGAALISLIGAGPSIAASRVEDETTSDTLVSVTEDLEDATGTVIAEQLSRKPTIYVDQGAGVTVLVDRDVVIW
ncbi:TrbI/VirB10 family protein [Leisingera sp. ANG-M1]|uniref:TrbI/VirB10 family protein n=1 Tax=Leisingera sp. ANG-M1 TaxID=1577895 RepID=UPI00315B3CF6